MNNNPMNSISMNSISMNSNLIPIKPLESTIRYEAKKELLQTLKTKYRIYTEIPNDVYLLLNMSQNDYLLNVHSHDQTIDTKVSNKTLWLDLDDPKGIDPLTIDRMELLSTLNTLVELFTESKQEERVTTIDESIEKYISDEYYNRIMKCTILHKTIPTTLSIVLSELIKQFITETYTYSRERCKLFLEQFRRFITMILVSFSIGYNLFALDSTNYHQFKSNLFITHQHTPQHYDVQHDVHQYNTQYGTQQYSTYPYSAYDSPLFSTTSIEQGTQRIDDMLRGENWYYRMTYPPRMNEYDSQALFGLILLIRMKGWETITSDYKYRTVLTMKGFLKPIPFSTKMKRLNRITRYIKPYKEDQNVLPKRSHYNPLNKKNKVIRNDIDTSPTVY